MDAQWHSNKRNEMREIETTRRLRNRLRQTRPNTPDATVTFFMGIGMGMSLPIIAYVAYELAILYLSLIHI